MININLLFKNYYVRKLNESDLDLIMNLYKNNKYYFSILDEQPSINSIKEDIYSLPNNKEIKDKYYIGLFIKEKLIGVTDLIDGYPNEKCAYLGLFMLDFDSQNKGLGTKLINELVFSLKDQGFNSIKLAYINDNKQAEHFWLKNGFVKDGKISMYKNKSITELERKL